jgi:ribonuclease E
MLINASHPEENRVAIVVDGILNELDIEIAGQEQTKGNIYKAVVIRVETGLQAAFVDYGAEKLGFLQIGEIHSSFYPPKEETNGRPRINDLLQRGQEILVQIVKEERGNKGAALTTNLSLPGRYMVLMPDSSTKGVSRKINDDSERKKLKKTMAELDLPQEMGYIVRTAGIGKDKEELKRDFDYLVRLYEGINSRKEDIKAPAQLYQESNLVIRSIRDYFTTDMDEVLIDDASIYQEAKDFFYLVMPELAHLVKRHRERRPIFSRYQIEEQIDALSKNQTALPSGGSIVLDQTEALVAIDVNSGKMSSENGIEATALRTNLEAATEIGRQLRLRDLGGLIVIDFIDMRDRKNIREIEQTLRQSLKNDKAKVSVGRISQFGLMEMSRQRLKPVLSVGAYETCPHCHGNGRIKSVEAQAVNVLRQTHTAASKGNIEKIEIKVPYQVANYLLNQKRKTINELEKQLGLEIAIVGSTDLLPGETCLEQLKRTNTTNNTQESMPISHSNQIENALAAAKQEEHDNTEKNDNSKDTLTDSAEDTPDPVKKKRRRRRRKPSKRTEATETTPVTGENTESKEPIGENASASENQLNAVPHNEIKANTESLQIANPETTIARLSPQPETQPEPSSSQGETQEKTVSEKQSTTDATIAIVPETASESGRQIESNKESKAQPEEAEEKPKRRRGRPRKNTSKTEVTQQPEKQESSSEQQIKENAVEPKKPTKRPRKTAVKNDEKEVEQRVAAEDSVAAESNKKISAEKAPKETTKRSRRSTPKSNSNTEDKNQQENSTSNSHPLVSTTAAQEPQEEKKSEAVKRPRRTRKPAAAKKQSTTVTAEPSTPAATEKAVAAKPRQTRKGSKPKGAQSTVDDSATNKISNTDEKPQIVGNKTTQKETEKTTDESL